MVMTAAEAAAALGLSLGRVRSLCAAGRIVGARRQRGASGYGWTWRIPAPIMIRPGTRGPRRKPPETGPGPQTP